MRRVYGFKQAKMQTTKKWHILEQGLSLCGFTVDWQCFEFRPVTITNRKGLSTFPKEDLNYCQKCRHIMNIRRNGHR